MLTMHWLAEDAASGLGAGAGAHQATTCVPRHRHATVSASPKATAFASAPTVTRLDGYVGTGKGIEMGGAPAIAFLQRPLVLPGASG